MFICDNLKIEVKIMNKLIAISTNGSNSIALVKSVNEQEYKKLVNAQAERLAKGEKLAIEHNKQHEYVEKRLNHYASQQVVLAKSIYDTYVDRGLIEKDEDFEKMWFDFYFNEKELNLKKAPQEFNKILVRVVAL